MNTLENFTRKNNSISDGCKVKTMGCLSSNKLLRDGWFQKILLSLYIFIQIIT